MDATSFLTWLAGTLLPLGVLWLLFRVVLRGERCFGYNRALLLLAPVLAAGLPLLSRVALPAWLAGSREPSAVLAVVLPPALQLAAPAAPAVHWDWLVWLYAAGVGVGLVRLAYCGWQLRRTTRRLPREARPGYGLAYTGGRLPTSSFGRTVFWDETAVLTPAEATAVLDHELAHVRQGHGYDVLWLETWRIVLWPNPFAHLLLPALRLTHELLADQAASPAVAAQPYATLLARLALRQSGRFNYFSLIQLFTFSFTLTRIAMLQTQTPVRRWKQWLMLPVLGGLFLVACQSSPMEQLAPPPVPTAIDPKVPANAAADKVYTYVDQMPALPAGGGMGGIVHAIQQNLVRTTAKIGAMPEGRLFVSFIVGADGTVRDVKMVKGLDLAYDEAAMAAIQQLPRFIPGMQSGKAVAVSFTVPIQLKPQ